MLKYIKLLVQNNTHVSLWIKRFNNLNNSLLLSGLVAKPKHICCGIKATYASELETCYQTEEEEEQRVRAKRFTYIISFKQAC